MKRKPMNMSSLKKSLAITGMLLMTINAFTQPGYNENVTVVAPYQPTISDAFKINFNPLLTDTVFTRPKLIYATLPKQMKTNYAVSPIKAAKVGEPTLPKLYKFLVKAGFGTYTTPYGELFANNLFSRNFTVGAHVKHLSSSGKLKGYGYPGYSNNAIDFYGTKFWPTHKLNGGIAYHRDVFHYYGFKTEDYSDLPSKNDIKQRYNLISANIKLNSAYAPDSCKLNHSAGFNWFYLADNHSVTENALGITADVNKELGLFKFTSSQVLGGKAKVDYYFDQDTNQKYNSGVISLQPYISTNFRAFNFYVGADLQVQADSVSTMHFYPVVNVQFNIVKNILVVFGGMKGGLKRDNYRAFSEENPYISPLIPKGFTNTVYDFYGGIKSSISKNMNFVATASYSNVKDMPFFVNDTSTTYDNMFTVVHDNVKILNVRGELAYFKENKYRLVLGGNFWNYDMKDELRAWHKPVFDGFLNFNYNIADKFIITTDLTGRSNVPARGIDTSGVVIKTLKGYIDISLGLEYRYSKILSAFLQLNNLATIRYFKWNNYPTHGFSLLGGITYAF